MSSEGVKVEEKKENPRCFLDVKIDNKQGIHWILSRVFTVTVWEISCATVYTHHVSGCLY